MIVSLLLCTPRKVDKTEAHLRATLRPGGGEDALRALPETGRSSEQVLSEVSTERARNPPPPPCPPLSIFISRRSNLLYCCVHADNKTHMSFLSREGIGEDGCVRLCVLHRMQLSTLCSTLFPLVVLMLFCLGCLLWDSRRQGLEPTSRLSKTRLETPPLVCSSAWQGFCETD